MDAPYSPLEFRLLNEFQRGFPLVERPFAGIADAVGAGEAEVLAALRRLLARGAASRIGAVLAPRRVGASTLAALAVPAGRLEAVAQMVSGRPEVNHNYEREHRYNLWFVATAADQEALEATLADIRRQADAPLISLPLAEEYHIDLGFDLCGGGKGAVRGGDDAARADLSAADRCLLAALEPGLEPVARPFDRLGERCGISGAQVRARLAAWLEEGLIKRFGVVVRHHELGYRANAMVVFDVPDDQVSEIGRTLAREAGVTLCYRRRRAPPEWTGNLFCMVHGRSREAVLPVVERLSRLAGRSCEVLFSVRRFKQRGARYFEGAHGSAAG
ncbi:MAG: Lrp/AsnC family transcriptional regulator [Rhodocyclaceae bacterium]|nr:Lrp/AsnC family transcriptional regulator [Rhodocyclaceae bacterium]